MVDGKIIAETAEVEAVVDFVQTFFIIIFTIMAFSFVPAAWIMYIVREKDTKCKHQQVHQCDCGATAGRVWVKVRLSL